MISADDKWFDHLIDKNILNIHRDNLKLNVYTLLDGMNIGYKFSYNTPNYTFDAQTKIRDNKFTRSLFNFLEYNKTEFLAPSTYQIKNVICEDHIYLEISENKKMQILPIKFKICETACNNILCHIVNLHKGTLSINNDTLHHLSNNVKFMLNDNWITRSVLNMLLGSDKELINEFGLTYSLMIISLIAFLKETALCTMIEVPTQTATNIEKIINNENPNIFSLLCGLNHFAETCTTIETKIDEQLIWE